MGELAGENWRGQDLPRWGIDIDHALSVQSQFIISGNVRDVYPVNGSDGLTFKPALDVLWDILAQRGYEYLLVYDPVDNLRVHTADQIAAARRVEGLSLDGTGVAPVSLERLATVIRQVARGREAPGAIVIDYASRLTHSPRELTADQHAFFTACAKIAHQARHLRPPAAATPPYNPVIWLVDQPNDLPNWLSVSAETVRSVVAGLPDQATRRQVAVRAADHFPDSASLSTERRKDLIDQFALLTDGMTARSLLSITDLARDPRFGLERIADAIRAYKVGAPDDPWKEPLVRDRIRSGEKAIGERVKGQDKAIHKSLDILVRSVMGLTGAQVGRAGGRPRGVLFFAGPTGVGKTELAKAITQLLFGDESAYHRFDMSEFSAEQSEARLIGAPPGYVGHDAGGELVNAVRQRPFSVLLFDEVEKAHPRILDKFLQILEDGRLTDGRGETVFFSEAVIIFTSNLGVYSESAAGEHVQNVSESDDYATVEERIKGAIGEHFRFRIQRPELLNRIGDNIVVFDFIRPEVANSILRGMLKKVVARVTEEHGLALTFSPDALTTLTDRSLEELSNGGRGIGNRLETFLINPLARALFESDYSGRTSIEIEALTLEGGRWRLTLA